MTPEELREALKPRGMATAVSEVSGWHPSWVSRIKRDGCDAVAPHIVADIMQAIPRAQKILQDRKAASTYHGTACSHCGGTLRYISHGNCVPCNTARCAEWRARVGASRRINAPSTDTALGLLPEKAMPCDEIRAALQQQGMCAAVERHSGYSHSHISEFKRTGRGSDEMVMALSYAVPLAQKEINQRRAEMTYTGSACARHGLVERYISSNQCVECAKYFARRARK
jgi:hypothetical protein